MQVFINSKKSCEGSSYISSLDVITLRMESKERKNISLTIEVYSGFLGDISYLICFSFIIFSICTLNSGICKFKLKNIC